MAGAAFALANWAAPLPSSTCVTWKEILLLVNLLKSLNKSCIKLICFSGAPTVNVPVYFKLSSTPMSTSPPAPPPEPPASVTVTVQYLVMPLLAKPVIIDEPAATAVTKPVDETVATFELSDVNSTVVPSGVNV